MATKPTFKQLALKLNLSQSTVTMVMKNRPGISDATRERVLSAAADMGLFPTTAVEGSIALIVSGLDNDVLSDNPFLTNLMENLNESARQNNYSFSIRYVNESDPFNEDFDGYVLLATAMSRARILSFRKSGKPMVVLDNSSAYDEFDTVVIDNENGIKKSVEHLASLGHIRIGYVHGDIIYNFIERYEAFIRVMEDCGLYLQDDDVLNVTTRMSSLRMSMKHAVASRDSFPTAFVADNDKLALELQYALREKGISVGKQVSVIGFDDISYAKLSSPPLSSIKVYHDNLAQAAIQRLVEIIKCPSPPRKYIVSTLLTVRESTDNNVIKAKHHF